MSGAHTSLVLSNLAPETTYEVALIPESNVHYFPPQTTRVTTLAGKMGTVVTTRGVTMSCFPCGFLPKGNLDICSLSSCCGNQAIPPGGLLPEAAGSASGEQRSCSRRTLRVRAVHPLVGTPWVRGEEKESAQSSSQPLSAD